MSGAQSLVRASALVFAGMTLTKLIGFVSQMFTAGYYGLSKTVDAFFIASTIPWMIFNVISTAIISTTVVTKTKFDHLQPRIVNQTLFTLIAVFSLAVSSLLLLLNPYLVRLLAPGFDPDTYRLAVQLSDWLLPMIIFMALAGYLTGLLHYGNRFLLPALTGIPYNLSIILMIVLLYPSFGIYALVAGTVLGAVTQAFIQLPGFRGQIKPASWTLSFNKEVAGYFALTILPIVIGSSVTQINVIVDRILASGLQEGAISALNFATRINHLPTQMLAASVAGVLLPTLSLMAKHDGRREFAALLHNAKSVMIFILSPLVIFTFVYAEDLVRILFERGQFTAQDTAVTGSVLRFFSLAMMGIALREIYNRAFISMGLTKVSMYAAFFTVGLNILFSVVLVRQFGIIGIAIGTSVAHVVSSFLLDYLIRRKLGLGAAGRRFETSKLIAALILTASILYFCRDVIQVSGFAGADGVSFVLKAAVMMVLFLAICMLLKVQTLSLVLEQWKKARLKLAGRRVSVETVD
ncbi:murein biosynthesis integral membrane protein MurJ [Cohnella sp. CFH 77786]|uniref:murein biosynthesis integral membrane protein MurJ n=1 Tax=Cohnella sp. CFH 77786 TaxID=2662265 RepID=UPI001C608EC7|nr:murein biosynthesis integral membrane protein MurJ [Cohnella sp. CFH 77786]MBW5447124.1 murein biosynthesis integral membrane protein MurJ [Cohnella sp. CFH 77786]